MSASLPPFPASAARQPFISRGASVPGAQAVRGGPNLRISHRTSTSRHGQALRTQQSPLQPPTKNGHSLWNGRFLVNLLFCWCREGGSNPHDRKGRRILSPLRLPVPPSRQFEKIIHLHLFVYFHLQKSFPLLSFARRCLIASSVATASCGETHMPTGSSTAFSTGPSTVLRLWSRAG